MTIPFLSRHIPTEAQAVTLRERFGEMTLPVAPVYEPSRVRAQIWHAAPETRQAEMSRRRVVVAGVFPGWALLELLRAGWMVVEFVNEPSARDRGTFVCRGAFVHTIEESEWIECPISVAEQGAPTGGLFAKP